MKKSEFEFLMWIELHVFGIWMAFIPNSCDYEHLVPAENRLAVDSNDKSLMALDYWDKAYIDGLLFRCSSSFLSLSHKPK